MSDTVVGVVEYAFTAEAAEEIRQAYADEQGVEIEAVEGGLLVKVFVIPDICLSEEPRTERFSGRLQRHGEVSKKAFFDCAKGKITVPESSAVPAVQPGVAACSLK